MGRAVGGAMTCKDTPPLSAQSHGGVAVAAWRVGQGEEEGEFAGEWAKKKGQKKGRRERR